MSFASLINTAWMVACRKNRKRFQRSVFDVAGTQRSLLRGILGSNQSCRYGREYNFANIRDADDFRSRLPIADYEHFRPWVDEICSGRTAVLTTEPVRLLEPTSGSVSGRRLIPYTDSLRRQFQNGIDPWIGDLFSTRPGVRRGRAYWAVTPGIQREHTSGGLPIGFADDAQYLGLAGRWAANRVMAVRPASMTGVSPTDAPLRTMQQLLRVPDLSLVSVWSPSFLSTLATVLEDQRDELIGLLPARDRAVAIVKSGSSLADKIAELWPRLALISCWADGAAATFMPQVRQLFSGVEIQPKGLISTEAFVSFPILGLGGSVLSIRSHLFEFQPENSTSDDTRLAHQLLDGSRYRVIVTTGGGLYRFQTHDVVEVVGHTEQCPLIRFIGRGDRTSDLVGEKLSESFVASAIQYTLEKLGISATFTMLVPRSDRAGYRLLIECEPMAKESTDEGQIAATLDRFLAKNPYYKHALQLGQLAQLAVTVNDSNTGVYWRQYEAHCLSVGMRRGDIKPTALETRFDWETSN
jgi:hypothetical protein